MVVLMKYTVLRLGLFVAVLALMIFLGAGPLAALIGASVISLLLSYVLLRGPRDALALQIAERAQRRLGGSVPQVDPAGDEAIEDRAIEDRATEDRAIEDRATEDKATEDKADDKRHSAPAE